jgi:hypothetical protein
MKTIKRVFLTIFVLTAVGFLLRGWLFRNLVTYKSIGPRSNYYASNEKLINCINEKAYKQTNPDIRQIIKLSLSITSEQLHFTGNKNHTDPNKLINFKTAHCVGYASFFSTTCNYLLKKNNLANLWTAKPQAGQLYFLKTNIHAYFNSSFFKDHDFVTIENKTTGEIYAVDPTVNDYLRIDFVSYSKSNKNY